MKMTDEQLAIAALLTGPKRRTAFREDVLHTLMKNLWAEVASNNVVCLTTAGVRLAISLGMYPESGL